MNHNGNFIFAIQEGNLKSLNDNLSWSILLITLALCTVGLIALSSTSPAIALSQLSDPNVYTLFWRQAIAMFVGFFFLILGKNCHLDKISNLPPKAIGSFSYLLISICIVLCVVMLFCPEQNGAKRWINLGFFNLQVAEICKICIILFWAHFLTVERKIVSIDEEYFNDREGFWCWLYKHPFIPSSVAIYIASLWEDLRIIFAPSAFTLAMFGLIEQGHDMGSIVLMGVTVGAMFWCSNFPNRLLKFIAVTGLVCSVFMILLQPYRIDRIESWINPMNDPQGDGYQSVNSFMALSCGGVFGRGLTYSCQKYGFLPEAQTDFILAIIGEELGLVGCLGIILLFFLLTTICFKLARRCKNSYLSMISFGIGIQLALQVLVNLSVVNGFFPNKGMPLPLISYGGSSVVFTLFSVGMLMHIANSYRTVGQRRKNAPLKGIAVCKASSISSSHSNDISSSSEIAVSPISSGEWLSIVRSDKINREPSLAFQDRGLPKPKASQGWDRSDTSIFRPLTWKEQRERHNRLQAIR